MNKLQCELKIEPKKENNLAVVSIASFDNSIKFSELESIVKSVIPNNIIISIECEEEVIVFNVSYLSQQMFCDKLISILVDNFNIEVINKKIFIDKLGGWFSF